MQRARCWWGFVIYCLVIFIKIIISQKNIEKLMKKCKNTTFMRNLIESDFLFIESSKKKQNNNSKLVLKLNVSKKLEILNLLDTNRDLKQLIRSLQFLNKKSNIFLGVEDFFKADLFADLLTKFDTSSRIQIITDLSFLPKKSKTALFLLLGTTKIDSSMLFEKGFFLIHRFNSSIEKNAFGTYKIYNDLEDLKKIVFLSCVIKTCSKVELF